jgi:hypothetical protein
MADPRGRAAFGPHYPTLVIASRELFGGDDHNGSSAIGMDILEMFNDKPVASVLMFQQSAWPAPAEEMVDELLKQVHGA